MKNKTIKINNNEFIIGVPYTFILEFTARYKEITTKIGDAMGVRISPYEQWNNFMMRKVNEGNRIIQNVTFNNIYDDPNTIAVKFEIVYTA